MRLVDLTGQRFTNWVVVARAGTLADGRQPAWLVRCICGTTAVRQGAHLRSGRSKSCGCLQDHHAPQKHGHAVGGRRSPTLVSYSGMLMRCYNESNDDYHHYGGRGIKVCRRWRGKHGFVHFLEDMGERPRGLSIERIDNDKGYSPRNCKWATQSEQVKNRRKL